MAKWDWYAATLPEYPRVVADALATELPGANGLVSGRGRHGYTHSANVVDDAGDMLATVLHGGPNNDPHVVSTGDNATAVAQILRKHWPDTHRVSRVDSCEDIHGDFGSTLVRVRAIADVFRVKGLLYAPDDPEDGSTYYLGATTSAVRFRLYEKGKQLRSQLADPATYRLDHLRLETQWRPPKPARQTASTLTPGEVWGVSAYTREIAATVLLGGPERIHTTARLRTTVERRNAALTRQYGSHLRDMLRAAGSPEAFGVNLAVMLGVIDDA
jgi:hypothetical protein